MDADTVTRVTPAKLVRGLSRLDATMIVVGSMIGSGIFITSAESSRLVGSPGWLLMAWALAGVLTITGALCCAELAAMWPRAGGQYVFLREAYGPSIGFLFGWGLFLIIQTGTIAAVASVAPAMQVSTVRVTRLMFHLLFGLNDRLCPSDSSAVPPAGSPVPIFTTSEKKSPLLSLSIRHVNAARAALRLLILMLHSPPMCVTWPPPFCDCRIVLFLVAS